MKKITLLVFLLLFTIQTYAQEHISQKIESLKINIENAERQLAGINSNKKIYKKKKEKLICDYFDLALIYYEKKYIDSANLLLQKIEDMMDYTISNYLVYINDLAYYYYDTKQFEKYEQISSKWVRYFDEIIKVKDVRYHSALISLARSYYCNRKYKEAEDIALTIINDENASDYALREAYSALALISSSTNKERDLLMYFQKLLGKTDNTKDRVIIMNGIINICRHIGDLENALLWNEQLLHESKDTLLYLQNKQQFAFHVFDLIGDIEIAAQQANFRMREFGGNSIEYAIGLINLAETLSHSEPKDTLQIYSLTEDALDILFTIADKNEITTYRNELYTASQNFVAIGEYEYALDIMDSYFIPLDNMYEPTPNFDLISQHIINYFKEYLLGANILSKMGDPQVAIDAYSDMIKILKNSKSDKDINLSIKEILLNLSKLYLRNSNYSAAEKTLSEALQIEIENSYLGQINNIAILLELSNLYYKTKEYHKSAEIKIKELNTFQLDICNKWQYLNEMQRAKYWSLVSLSFLDKAPPIFYKSNSAETAKEFFSLLLFSKGLLLNSSIALGDIIAESEDLQLISKYNYLLDIQNQLDKSKYASDSLKQLKENLEYELIKESKLFGDYTKNLKLKWHDVQTQLTLNDVAIEFVDFSIPETDSLMYAALILKKDWPAPKMITLFEKKELDALTDVGPSELYDNQLGKPISNLIWTPLAEYLAEGDNVYFSPSGALHHLAIESLPLADGRLASEKYNLYRLSTTKQLCYEHPERAYNKAVLYGGLTYDLDDEIMKEQSRAYSEHRDKYAMRGFESDSSNRAGWNLLSGSKEEVENISVALKKRGIKATLFEEAKGNEESFRALSGEKNNIIHIATHGFFFPLQEVRRKEYFNMLGDNAPVVDNSMRRSGLIMSGGNKAWRGEQIPDDVEDGVLTAQEIMSLDLRGADLVVLSACQTGLGEVSGEGVFGLQRAFKKAGAQTLIMSLWIVDDKATGLMMSEFYAQLLSGKSKREAFLEAQAKVKAKHEAPYYWAGFIMLD